MIIVKYDDIFSLKLYSETIHCKFVTPQYQTVCWDAHKRLLYKIKNSKNSKDWNREEENLLPDEKEIFKKMFYGVGSIPEEKEIKECLIVFYDKFYAIGLKIMDLNNFIAFKSEHVDKVKKMCVKNTVTLNYDRYMIMYLMNYGYINEIIPENIFHYTAKKYARLIVKDKYFAKNFNQMFGII